MMSYNGYTNYETWAVMLWIDNNESSSAYWRQMAREMYYHRAAEQAHFSREEDAVCLLAEKLRESYSDQMERVLNDANVQGTVWADLLNASVCAVHFHEVAKNLMEGVVPSTVGA
jgi:hypothetical protein